MTDDVLDQLTDAGALLDRDGRAAVAERAGQIGAYAGPEPVRGTPTRRRRGAVLAAAAVLLVVAGIWVALSRGDDGFLVTTVDPASDGGELPGSETVEPSTEAPRSETVEPSAVVPDSTVAFIPSGGTSEWEAVNMAGIGPAGGIRGDYVIVVPSGPNPSPERSVGIRRDTELGPTGGLTPVSGSGLTGFWRSDSGRGRAELVVAPRDGSTFGFTMWTGQTLTTAELFDIAARLDPEQPLPGQSLGDDWVAIAEGNPGTVHNFQLVQGIEGPDRSWLWGNTYTGMAPEARWFVDEPYLGTAVEVRGKPGVLIVDPGGHMATVVWTEAPGVVVQLTWGRLDAPSDERVQGVLAAAADLVPVDASQWAEFTAEVIDWP